MSNKVIYFPGLNGLRAIASLAVVFGHITNSLSSFGLNAFILGKMKDGSPKSYILGGHGVTIFFVLSGFLITYLLLAEKERKGIDLKKFYFRRILRIWPLYYLYLVLVVIVMIIFSLKIDFNALLFIIFYTANIPFIFGASIPLLSHYWSLGVEEQFYLFWPIMIQKLTNKNMVIVLITIIVFLIIARYLLHLFYPGSIWEVILHVTRFHCMMIGGVGAILLKNNNNFLNYFIDSKFIQLVCWIFITLLILNYNFFPSIAGPEVVSLVTLFIIIGQIGIKNRLINLEIPLFDFLGKISYGIYVIHVLIIFLFSKLIEGLIINNSLKYFLVYGSIITITILCAYTSYTYFERYFLKLKAKFVVVNSKASRNSVDN